ncbi:putative response regulator [Nitrincola lacisaponensis]|uniref:Putative response regulator n=1 Tax=Nitrincola lacisaponensis TaxID=267850 RepID=A0A063Y4U7_9GAMM|nr:tetratricopeptide repeat protein [Nitrincola lacisaponensis]KDE40699.1 putative response regulator [Nitrincola lacisaponensis]
MTALFSDQTVLIVEKNLEELEQLRQILSAMGFRKIEVASSVNMAASLLAEVRVDLCFLVYDLGRDEKNGLQVLQQLKAAGRPSYATCFLLVVEPQKLSLLMGSPDLSADGYLAKPYDQLKLRAQLEKQLRIKRCIAQVERFRDQRDWDQALEECERLQKQFPALGVLIFRIKGLVYLEQQQYQKALAVFERIRQAHDKPWVHVALGLTAYDMTDYQRARREMTQVIEEQQVCQEAFLIMARIHWLSGERSQCVTLLRKAVMLQPTMPVLQGELGNRAAFSEELSVAADGFRQAVQHARHTALQNPEYYFGLVRVIQQLIADKPDRTAEFIAEAIRVLESVVHDCMDDPQIRFRARLIAAEIYRQNGEHQNADFAAGDALAQFRKIPLNAQLSVVDLLADGLESTRFAVQAAELKQEVSRSMPSVEWGKSNLKGMLSFRQKAMDEAFKSFEQAWLADPGNPGVGLNLLQTGIESLRRQTAQPQIVKRCSEIVNALHYGSLSGKQQQRYQMLSERFGDLIREAEIA